MGDVQVESTAQIGDERQAIVSSLHECCRTMGEEMSKQYVSVKCTNCGQTPGIDEVDYNEDGSWWEVECQCPWVSTGETSDDAVVGWNKRQEL